MSRGESNARALYILPDHLADFGVDEILLPRILSCRKFQRVKELAFLSWTQRLTPTSTAIALYLIPTYIIVRCKWVINAQIPTALGHLLSWVSDIFALEVGIVLAFLLQGEWPGRRFEAWKVCQVDLEQINGWNELGFCDDIRMG